MLVSIVIPAYNPGLEFIECLSAIALSSYKSFEVVIVDDCSHPEIELPEIPIPSKLIRSEVPLGPAEARNIGAKSAKGEIILFIDSDVTVENDTILKIAQRFTEEPELAAVSGLYNYRNRYKNPSSLYHSLYIEYKQKYIPPEGPYADTAIRGIRRNIFNAFGGFKAAIYTGEDLELGSRLYRSGHKICCDHGIRVTHNKQFTFKGWLKNRFCHCVNMVITRLASPDKKENYRRTERAVFTIFPSQIVSAFLSWAMLISAAFLFASYGVIARTLTISLFTLYLLINSRYLLFICRRAYFKAFLLIPFILIEHLLSLCAVITSLIRLLFKLPHIAYRGS